MSSESSQDERFPQRKRPAHPPVISTVNRPTVVFLTVCVRGKRPLLANQKAHDVLKKAWSCANKWIIGRYVIMPDHLHMFCSPVDIECALSQWIGYWRNMVTREWDRADEKPIWQREYWDRQLRRQESYSEKWEYVRMNPVRAGLVDTPDRWPYAGEMNILRW